MEYICVFCASSTAISEKYFEAAHHLGKAIASQGYGLVCGAGAMGLMAAVSDAVLQYNGKVTGVIPRFMCDENWHHKNLSELIVTQSMHERKEKMAQLASAVVAMPGGVGTLEELLEIITWKQLGIFNKPIVILNTDGYFDPLLTMFDKAVDESFMRDMHRDLWTVVAAPEMVVPAIKNAKVWDSSIRKLAAI